MNQHVFTFLNHLYLHSIYHFTINPESPAMGNSSGKNESSVEFLGADSPLLQAQNQEFTSSGIRINNKRTAQILTRRELEKMRHANVSNDVRIILNKPFSNVDRITDTLYLTGIGGVLLENIKELKIRCIINATHEMPLAKLPKVASLRVPVDDDPTENIFIYLDDVATVIHNVSKKGGRTLVHCLAGASRSSTLVIGEQREVRQLTNLTSFFLLFRLPDQVPRVHAKECLLLSQVTSPLCPPEYWLFRAPDQVRVLLPQEALSGDADGQDSRQDSSCA